MQVSDTILCKPTSWFIYRALAMLTMLGVFSVLFYTDGSTGYRKKNVVFYLYQTFERAGSEFSEFQANGGLTPDQWNNHASAQTVIFPSDTSVLPSDIQLPMPWPSVLADFEKMKSLQWNHLWLEFSAAKGYPATPSDEPYSAKKIQEQWIVFYICCGLFLFTAWMTIRTISRSISADADGITPPNGTHIPYSAIKTLDLRKWLTKGLAYIDYEGPSGKGRCKIDGLTYGGFKKEHNQPAEQLLQLIQAHFSGEIIEYVTIAQDTPKSSDESGTQP